MASLVLDRDTRAAPELSSRAAADLIDPRAISADLENLAKAHTGGAREIAHGAGAAA